MSQIGNALKTSAIFLNKNAINMLFTQVELQTQWQETVKSNWRFDIARFPYICIGFGAFSANLN